MNNETENVQALFLNFLEDTEDESRFNALYNEMEKLLGIPTLSSIQEQLSDGEISEHEGREILRKSNQIICGAILDLMRISLPYDSLEKEFAIAAYHQSIKENFRKLPMPDL